MTPASPHATHPTRHSRRAAARATLALAIGVLGAASLVATRATGAQGARNAAVVPAPSTASTTALAALPFATGERLVFQVHAGRFGRIGRGSMWVDTTSDERGERLLALHFAIHTRVGPVKVVNETESWLDPVRMAARRFHKHERHPLSRHDEEVELVPEERRWSTADGEQGTSTTDRPLDELSFIYFLRTLALDADTTFQLERHFDPARNPTTVRVLGREVVETPAGSFPTIIVEMRVRDSRRYKGEGVIRFNLSDDHCRLPVRIESVAPIVGRTVLLLESHVRGPNHLVHAP